MTFEWVPSPYDPDDSICYLDGRTVGWVEQGMTTSLLDDVEILLPRDNDGAVLSPPACTWHGWQVGTASHPIAAGAAPSLAAARACVELVAAACGWVGMDISGRDHWRTP